MASISRRRNGYLVRWKENRRERSRYFAQADMAESFKETVERRQLASRVLSGTPGIPGWNGEVTIGAALDDEMAFERYARRLIEQDAELRISVREKYISILQTRIEGSQLGQADIRTIGPDVIQAYWIGVDRNRRNVYQLIAKTFNAAVRAGVIEVSPMRRANVKRPSARIGPEDRVLPVDELERLADNVRDPRGRMAVLLMGYCGLRAGEVGGLRREDVAAGRLYIRQAVVQTGRTKYVSPPKTPSARRTVAMPPSVAKELEAFISANPPAADGRIFHRGNGELWAHQAINHQVQKAAKRAGLPPVHAHQLRHTAVSLLIDDGANPKAIQVFVGHARIEETLGTYGHLFDHGGDALAASMERRRQEHRNT